MNKGKMVSLSVLLAVMTLGFVLFPRSFVEAKSFRLNIGTGHPAGPAIWVNRLKDFFVPEVMKRVEASTNHKMEFIAAYGGSVAKLGEVLEAVQDGILDAGIVCYVFEPSKLYMHNFCYYAPFGTPDIMQNARLSVKLHDQQPYLKEVFEKKYNQKWLAPGTLDSYDVVTKFPWKKIDELKNHKIAGAGPNLPWVKCVGAIPVQFTLVEAYTSIQTGVYEGAIMWPDGVAGFKLHEVAPFYTHVGFGAISVMCISVNLDVWNRLPKEIQKIMMEVASEYTTDLAKASVAKRERSFKAMEKTGTTFSTLPFEERQRWANLMPNFADQAAKKANKMGMPGSAIMKTWIELQEKDGYKFPRKWDVK
ncbi:MAG: C4-dicarboxylate TRAP transporter substrate-binding protein [Desulfatiglans sp.]|jgi:TRAP-type C4-dicarboxylate transport system substrate-binding protein|nr:C4-dicarboxylate TRAP transporter substrate-binding protein [Thermodesulfobacteriota bacterium]MEE4351693.1 C4-dicarboxylate TRAP transporter substrate-binding protein [Desulfatiglans sp.]